MQLRKLHITEYSQAAGLSLKVYLESGSRDFNAEGLETFKSFVNSNELINELTIYGAFEQNKLIGILGTKNKGTHLSLFFILPEYQRKGIGRKLFDYAFKSDPVEEMTVNSSSYAIEFYRSLGFEKVSEEEEKNGIKYTPMKHTYPNNQNSRTMNVTEFIANYREAFGEAAGLPIVFWYSDTPIREIEKINGCFFKGMKSVREGEIISLSSDTIGCFGGKLYTGFTDISPHIPNFVSLKERYKQTPQMVVDYIESLHINRAEKKYIHFARIDKIDSFEGKEGLVFFATPDILSGLTTWTYFDNNSPDAVVSMFGSGCSAIVTQVVTENIENGNRTFIGFFDPSARIHFEPDLLSFAIPMSRFKVMYHTMRQSCLFDTHAWGKIKERINGETS